MSVFISHSSQDIALYSSIVETIDLHGIPRWDIQRMIEGKPLSEQLGKATQETSQCVFLATKNSIDSSWCMSELGAFWGADKPVTVYLGESDLTEELLPPQLQGHLHANDAKKLIRAIKENEPIHSRLCSEPIESEVKDCISNLIKKARNAAEKRDYQLAYDLSCETIGISPDCIRAYGNKGTALVHLRRYAEAKETYNYIIEAFSSNDKLLARTYHNLAWLEINRSGLYDSIVVNKCKNLYHTSLSLDETRLITRAMYLICLGRLNETKNSHHFLYESIQWKDFIETLRRQVEILGLQGFQAIEALPKWLKDILFPPKGNHFSLEE